MTDLVRIRFEAVLSNETFGGRYHTGGSVKDYSIRVPLEMRKIDDLCTWKQLPDDKGNIDPRMPANGFWQREEANMTLYDDKPHHAFGAQFGGGVAELVDFNWSSSASTPRGRVRWLGWSKTYKQGPDSNIDWHGKGAWTILSKYIADAQTSATGWKFKTSGGASGGAAIVAGAFGTLVLTDPLGRNIRFNYKAGGFSKGLKFGATASREEFWNKGSVLRNKLVVGNRELKTEDFLGCCWWGDFGAAAVGGVSGMGLFAGCPAISGAMSFKAIIPIFGVVGGGGLGFDIMFGSLSISDNQS